MKTFKLLFVLIFLGLVSMTTLVACGDDDDDDDDDSNEITEFTCDEETCTDPDTGLIWQRAHKSGLNLEEAISYCENLNLSGYNDWWLPTISELRFLIKGCDATESGGSCGATVDCNSWECLDDSCSGCSQNSGPGPDGLYWRDEFGTSNNSTFWVPHDSSGPILGIDFSTGGILHLYSIDGGYSTRCARQFYG